MIERTLSIIKPDAVRRGAIGEILTRFNDAGLRLIATRLVRLSAEEAAEFYAVHRGKPFYESLVEFMSSGPILVSVLEGDDAIGAITDQHGCYRSNQSGSWLYSARFWHRRGKERDTWLRRR